MSQRPHLINGWQKQTPTLKIIHHQIQTTQLWKRLGSFKMSKINLPLSEAGQRIITDDTADAAA